MTSLKLIMDVDIEPLESQAYRRSREAALLKSSMAQLPDSLQQTALSDILPTKSASSSDLPAPSPSATTMDFPTNSYSPPSPVRRTSDIVPRSKSVTASSSTATPPVKYTPITGRVSRAKKGVKVHTCDQCEPARIFTRAEHLRRHELSHKNPTHPCKVVGCERTFHRLDLLTRHIQQKHVSSEGKPEPFSHSRSSSTTSNRDSTFHTMPPPQGRPGSQSISTNPSHASAVLESHQSLVGTPNPPFHGKRSNRTVLPGEKSQSATLPDAMAYNTSSSDTDHGIPGSNGHGLEFSSVFPATPVLQMATSLTRSPSTVVETMTIPSVTLLNQTPDVASNSPLTSLPFNSIASPWDSTDLSPFSATPTNSVHDDTWNVTEPILTSSTSGSPFICPNYTLTTPNIFDELSHTYNSTNTRSYQVENDQHIFRQPMYPQCPLLMQERKIDEMMLTESSFTPITGLLSTNEILLAQWSGASVNSSNSPNSESALVGHYSHDGAGITVIPNEIPPIPVASYVDAYFQHFHQTHPIIHKPSFTLQSDVLLDWTMACIGCQYIADPVARTHAIVLNDLARRELGARLRWNLSTMQAILLMEMFNCYRARRIIVNSSIQFDNLFDRLYKTSINIDCPSTIYTDLDQQWNAWIDKECHLRLFICCFMFDVHQCYSQAQPRASSRWSFFNEKMQQPCSSDLWEAVDAMTWYQLKSNHARQDSHVDLSLQLARNVAYKSACLPKRSSDLLHIESSFDNTDQQLSGLTSLYPSCQLAHIHAALYCTPLRDLLAVSGNTWLFGKKIHPAKAFHDRQERLNAWLPSPIARQAAYHASQYLLSALVGDGPVPTSFHHLLETTFNMFDYWSIYVATLICWAIGTPKPQTAKPKPLLGHSRLETLRHDSVRYLKGLQAPTNTESPRNMDVQDPSSLVELAIHRLNLENFGNKNALLVDAISVLKRIHAAGQSALS